MSSYPSNLDSRGVVNVILSDEHKGPDLVEALGVQEGKLSEWIEDETQQPPFPEIRLALYCLRHELIKLYLEHGGVLPAYNIYGKRPIRSSKPVGYDVASNRQNYPLVTQPTKIGGHLVNYPLGIPAGTLTGSHEWIEYYARRGFDVLTFRTVRTRAKHPFEDPNWVFVADEALLTKADVANEKPLMSSNTFLPDDPRKITMANSYGVASLSPDIWQDEIEKSRRCLGDNQILIVSVTGSANPGEDIKLVDDFVSAAKMAKEAGAHLVELNISHALQGAQEGFLYLYPNEAAAISRAVYDAIGERPFLKIGYMSSPKLQELVTATADCVAGFTAINTVLLPVEDTITKNHTFPPSPTSREKARISGYAIKNLAKEVVQELCKLRDIHHYDYDVLAVGGVSTTQDVEEYLNMGATGVMTCTTAFINPNFAFQVRRQKQERGEVNTMFKQRPPASSKRKSRREEVEDFDEVCEQRPVPFIPLSDELMKRFGVSEEAITLLKSLLGTNEPDLSK